MFHEGDTRQSSNDKPVALDWNLEMLVFEEGGKRRTQRKTIGARERTNYKLNLHMTPGPGIEPGTHWWQASALTTAFHLLMLIPRMLRLEIAGLE